MPYLLRHATENDREMIFALKCKSIRPFVEKLWGWNESYQRRDFETDFEAVDNFRVIEIDRHFVGFLQYYTPNPYLLELAELHLLPEYRGRGIGSEILQCLMRTCVSEHRVLRLGCFKENLRARALYEKLGFTLIEESNTHFILEYDKHDPS